MSHSKIAQFNSECIAPFKQTIPMQANCNSYSHDAKSKTDAKWKMQFENNHNITMTHIF